MWKKIEGFYKSELITHPIVSSWKFHVTFVELSWIVFLLISAMHLNDKKFMYMKQIPFWKLHVMATTSLPDIFIVVFALKLLLILSLTCYYLEFSCLSSFGRKKKISKQFHIHKWFHKNCKKFYPCCTNNSMLYF